MLFVPRINVNRMKKYQLRHLSPIVLLSMMAISLFSCGKNDPNGGSNDSIPTDSSMAASTSSLSARKINKGILFLDISKSMKGYTKAVNPTFFGVLSDFICMDENVVPYFYGKEEKSIEDIKNAINILNAETFDWADESKLADMVKDIVRAIENGSVSWGVIVSDGIMSGSNEDINSSSDKGYNVANRGVLANEIEGTFRGKRDLSALILRYVAPFKGTYYCYNNDKKTLEEVRRPFFAILIGQTWKVEELSKEVKRDSVVNEVLLGGGMPFDISMHPVGKDLVPDQENRYKIDGKKDLVLTADISRLPDYMKDKEYMETHLTLERILKGGRHIRLEKDSIGEGRYEITSIDSENMQIKITGPAVLRMQTLVASISYELPFWVKICSSDDDREIKNKKSEMEKTFNLRYFIEAFEVLNQGDMVNKQDSINFK